MSAILVSDHKRILKQIKRFYLVAMIFIAVLSFVLSPMFVNAPTPDRRTIVLEALRGTPLTVGQALSISEILSKQNTVPVPLLLAIIDVESQGFFHATSHKNCKGLFQLSESVWIIYAKNTDFKNPSHAFNPELNAMIAIQYLNDLFSMYRNWDKVLQHYFCGNPENRSKEVTQYVKNVQVKIKQYGG